MRRLKAPGSVALGRLSGNPAQGVLFCAWGCWLSGNPAQVCLPSGPLGCLRAQPGAQTPLRFPFGRLLRGYCHGPAWHRSGVRSPAFLFLGPQGGKSKEGNPWFCLCPPAEGAASWLILHACNALIKALAEEPRPCLGTSPSLCVSEAPLLLLLFATGFQTVWPHCAPRVLIKAVHLLAPLFRRWDRPHDRVFPPDPQLSGTVARGPKSLGRPAHRPACSAPGPPQRGEWAERATSGPRRLPGRRAPR